MIQPGRALVASFLLVATVAVVTARADDSDGASATVPVQTNIVNGIPTHLQPTTGALLFVGPDLKNQFLDCSAVLIGCRTALTAAHCVCETANNAAECLNDLPNLDVADLRVFFQHSGFHHVREIYIDPAYVAGVGGDLAMLRLSELVTGIEPSPYHRGFPTSPDHGTPGLIAGFGDSGFDNLDEAIKRVGSIETAACVPGTGVFEPANICWNFTGAVSKPGDEANLCLADDGGPLFIDYGNGPEVAGIHAGGGSTCDVAGYSYDTNVARARDWIDEVGGLDVKRDQCSELGEVGEPWVKVQGGEGNLPKNEDEKLFSFIVPEDALVLRVSVNGDTDQNGDYDMFVGLGQKIPTRLDNDCQARGVGQFGFCSFEETGTDHVNVLIRRARPRIGTGHSRFQVTVTAYQQKPPADDPPRGPDNLRYSVRGPGLRTLTWIDDSKNETGFELQRRPGTDPLAAFTRRATIKADKQLYLESIPDDQVFTYRIRAFNGFGSSEWSNICVVNLPRMHRPTRLHATALTPDAVTLKWRDNSNGESAMELQRRKFGSLAWKAIKVLPSDTKGYVDTGITEGQTYQYRVRARGFLDECIPHSRFSNVLEVTVPAP
ncbi:MAG TPA: trypsin-like serine protease [Candidatus Limnocylindrales bacterium]|nr:trypsin-like serine protease [Candidatus Limnocylindrales bacterium]